MKSRKMITIFAALMAFGLYGCAEEGSEFGEQPGQQDTFEQQQPEQDQGTMQQQPGGMQQEEGGMQQEGGTQQ